MVGRGDGGEIKYLPLPQTLLVQLWYPCTVATNSRAQKIVIAEVKLMAECQIPSLHH